MFKMDANDDTMPGLAQNQTVQTNNETKMSDNEAFMAYMSKAEGEEDDE